MSPLSRLRIKVITSLTIITIIIGLSSGFSQRVWVFAVSFWLMIGVLGFIFGVLQDHWYRLRTRDLFRSVQGDGSDVFEYIERDRN